MGELGRGEQSARMKAIILRGLLWAAVATADQSHHQSFKQGNSPAVHVSVHKPHGAVHALVHSQPAASPQSVHGYGGYEKPIVGVHAPAALPYHAPEPYHAPIVHPQPYHAPEPYHPPAPVYHSPAPLHVPAPIHAPLVHHAPVHHAAVHRAPVHHAAVHHAPAHHAAVHHAPVAHHAVHHAPVHHAPAVVPAPVVHHAPVVHTPAYHAPPKPVYHAPPPHYKEPTEPYSYEYAVSDDYSKASYHAGQSSDEHGAVTGSYSVALPDGRTQHVHYTADHVNGYVAEVTYEGTAHYEEVAPYHAPPRPAYHAPAPPAYHAPLPAYHA